MKGPHGLSPYALDPSYSPQVDYRSSYSASLQFLMSSQAPEFIFPVEARSRSWNEIWFNRVGCGYFLGLSVGGVWGLKEGLFNPEGGKTYRMRANSLLNGLTRRGPFMANTLGVLSMLKNDWTFLT